MIFFFQAEDGIRDLVRSRGLGDVYKRQQLARTLVSCAVRLLTRRLSLASSSEVTRTERTTPVSYTHLTLPTSDLV